MTDLFDREPDFTYTDDDAIADGELINVASYQWTADGRPVTRCSRAVWQWMGRSGCTCDIPEEARTVGAMLRHARDTAEPGEPVGTLYEVTLDPIVQGAFGLDRQGQDRFWLMAADASGPLTLMFPSDY
jgi:hypothetical protein